MEERLIVELDQDAPPAGRVLAEDGSIEEFFGWTGLAAAITAVTQELSGHREGTRMKALIGARTLCGMLSKSRLSYFVMARLAVPARPAALGGPSGGSTVAS